MAAWQPSRPRPSAIARSRHRLGKAVPLVVWCGAVLGLFKLAEIAPSAHRLQGLVETQESILLAPVDGRLLSVAVQLHQVVEAGAVVARFDDREVRLRLAQTTFEVERLRADMTQVQADLERDARTLASEQQLDAAVEHRRLVSAIESAQLAALATRTDLEETRIRLQGAEIETERLTKLVAQGVTPEPELVAVRTERDALHKRLTELVTLYDENRVVVATSKQRLEEFRPARPIDPVAETALAPLRWQCKQQEAELECLALAAEALLVKAPIGGHVAAIAAMAGEWAPAGRELLRIVDPTPRRIRAWVPDTMRERLDPARAMHVHRADASLAGSASVLSISPTAVRLPERLWRDPQREEWGFEIVLAATGAERPGEHVQLAPQR